MLSTNILGANLKSQYQANSLPRTPKQDGFYFPAEWNTHEYTIMQFVPRQNWAGYGTRQARKDWATVANTLSELLFTTRIRDDLASLESPTKVLRITLLSGKRILK